MALTIKQLNCDASFFLSFEPIATDGLTEAVSREPFRVLLDPRLAEPHASADTDSSSSTYTRPGHVSSLKELPAPDLVIVTQAVEDHCHEQTLKQLPVGNTKTVVLAEAAAAKRIRSWKHFDDAKVQALEPWQNPRTSGAKDTVVRVEVPSMSVGGDPGEVTISFISQRRELRRSSYAVGITYRPPPSRPSKYIQLINTSPTIPTIQISAPPGPEMATVQSLYTTTTAKQLPSAHSATTTTTPTSPDRPTSPLSIRSKVSASTLSPHAVDRALSVIFSPHGIPYTDGLEAFATSHLVSEAALPLTALLHCFDSVSAPWWLPRPGASAMNALGMPAGLSTASTLAARAWIRAHAGDRDTKSPMWKLVRRRKYGKADVQRGLRRAEGDGNGRRPSRQLSTQTEVLVLRDGEEVTLTSEGVWDAELTEAVPETSSVTTSHVADIGEYKLGEVLTGVAAEPLGNLIRIESEARLGNRVY